MKTEKKINPEIKVDCTERIKNKLYCDSICHNKAKRYVFLFGFVNLIMFTIGYFTEFIVLRFLWLTLSGTFIILSGIVMYLLLTRNNWINNNYIF